MIRKLLIAGALVILSACSQVQVTEHKDLKPQFNPQEFFSGQLSAHGVIKNRKGKVTRTFNADIEARWDNGVATLDENFVFNDGEKQQRIWTLTPTGDDTYNGTAGDVIGDGKVTLAGNSMFLNYVLQVPYGDGTVNVKVDDRMYLVSPSVLINESRMSKFGFRVGTILLTIIRQH